MRRVAQVLASRAPSMGDRGRLGGAGSRAAIADTGSGVLVTGKWPWAVAGVLAVIALGSGAYAMAVGDGEPAASAAPAPTPSTSLTEQEREEGAAALLRTGAEGVFVLSVTSVHCGAAVVGPTGLRQRARGTFCLVGVAVENAGQEVHLLDGGAQRAVDTRGRAYAVAGRAAAVLNDRTPPLFGRIAPGTTVHGVLPFDVPRGTRLAALLLHDRPGSRGARVPLA